MASTDATSLPDAIAEEMKKLQGTWKQIAYERDGMTEPPDEQGWEPRTTFAGDTFVVTLADGSVPIKGTYRLDPTRSPKTVDWMDSIGEDAGKTLLAIYSLEEDRLVFCAAYPGLPRPTELRAGKGQVLRVHQRELDVRQLVRRYFELVFDAPEVSTFTDLFAPDGVLEDPVGTPPLRGRDAIGQFLAAGRAFLERIDFEVHEIYPCGRECAVRWSAVITTKRGERVMNAGIGIFSFDEHHKLRHVREFYDAGMLRKLFSG